MNVYFEPEEVSIEEHPDFRTPRSDWRVRPAYVDDETGEIVPEDRSDWRPEEDGKCMADFYDFENRVMRDGCPMAGVSTFFRMVKRERG